MVDATVRLFEEKRGERAQICSLQSSENVSKSRKPIDFCVLSLGFDSFQFSLLSFFIFFAGKISFFVSFFVLDLEKKKRERERERERERKRVTMATTTRALRWSAKAVGLRRRGPRSRPFSPTPPTLFDATITRLGGSGGGASCSFGVVAKAEESRSTTGALPEFVDTAIPKDVLEMFKVRSHRRREENV